MINVNDFLVRNIYRLLETNKVDIRSPKSPFIRDLLESKENIIALMLIVTREPYGREVKYNHLVSLRTIFQHIPIALKNGTVSWLKIEGEEYPSTLVIHQVLSSEQLLLLAKLRYTAIARQENLSKGVFTVLFGNKEKAFNTVRQAQLQAKESTLINSEPLAPLLKEVDSEDLGQLEKLPVESITSIKAHIVINRTMEDVFHYVADISHFSLNIPVKKGDLIDHTLVLRATQQIPSGSLQIGTTFLLSDVTTADLKADATITEYTSPYNITCSLKGWTMPIRETKIMLTSVIKDKTEMLVELKVSRSFFSIFWPFVIPSIKRQLTTYIEEIKSEIENSK